MFGYKVEIEQYCDHHERDEEQYGSWSASYSNSINSVVQKTNDYPDVVSTLDIEPGTKALVVWAVWSTGDSFGRARGSQSEAIGIFTDMASAVQFREALDAHEKQGGTVKLTTSDGQEFEFGYMPWFGYFESLDSVHIDVVTVV